MRLICLTAALMSSLCSASEFCDARFADGALKRFTRGVPASELPLYGLTSETLSHSTLGQGLRMGVLGPDGLAGVDEKSTIESTVRFGTRWLYPVVSAGRWVALVELEDDGVACVAVSFGSSRLASALESVQSVVGTKAPVDVVFIPQALEFHVARRDAPRDLVLALSSGSSKQTPRFSTLRSVATRVKPIVARATAGAR